LSNQTKQGKVVVQLTFHEEKIMEMKDMFSSNKLMDRFFRKVDGAVWDLMSGKIGIKTADGIVTMEGSGEDATVTLNMIEQFGIGIPAFAQNTPQSAVQIGDLIYGAKGPLGWITEKNEKSFKLLKSDGTHTVWSPPKVAMFGFDGGVMVLRSLMNMLPGGAGGLAGMQGALMPLLMMGGDGMDIGDMMPMLLMGQMGMVGTTPAANPDGTPVAPVANPMANMLPMMMMMQMMKGKGGSNGGFFDAPVKTKRFAD
jgi:hypothetical protein